MNRAGAATAARFTPRARQGHTRETRSTRGGESMAADRSYVAENRAQLERLQAVVDRLSDRDLAHPMDAGWTVAGVLAHLAFWDYRIVTLLDGRGPRGSGDSPARS